MGSTLELTGAQWRKSSYSTDTGGSCVECAPLNGAAWRKSSYSGDQGGSCIEVAETLHTVAVRDSKDISRPALHLSRPAFAAFVDTL